jgi:hypothetical protein
MSDAVIIDAVRTPLGKGRPAGALAGLHPVDLLAHALAALVERTGIDPRVIDDVIAGCVSQIGEQSTNIARRAVLAAGYPERVPATSVKGMGIDEVLTAPQNPFAERLIGSIRRECLNHVLVLGERHLRRILARYFGYYHQSRTHLALDKGAPDARSVERSEAGRIVEIPEVGGLHHRYIRRAA